MGIIKGKKGYMALFSMNLFYLILQYYYIYSYWLYSRTKESSNKNKTIAQSIQSSKWKKTQHHDSQD